MVIYAYQIWRRCRGALDSPIHMIDRFSLGFYFVLVTYIKKIIRVIQVLVQQYQKQQGERAFAFRPAKLERTICK